MDGPNFFFIILFLLMLGLLVLGVRLTGASIDTLSEFLEDLGRVNRGKKVNNRNRVKDPDTLLKLRYVKGEISKEEYEEIKKVIQK